MKSFLLIAALAGGCGAEIADGARVAPQPTPSGDDTMDPDPMDPDPVTPDAPPAAATCSNGRVVYLNFEGATIKTTQQPSDATLDAANWTDHQLHTPAYHAGSATRIADMTSITDQIKAALAQFPVTVVTTRPASGSYMMIVFGGSAVSDLGADAEYAGFASLDCGDNATNDLSWISDACPTPTYAATVALGTIGLGLGLSGSKDPANCMCGWAGNCTISSNAACSFATASSVNDACANNAAITQNEIAAIHAGFCEPLN